MKTMVSIITTAYNHAPYISQALESFIKQKTDFSFEVIVHDDASSDGTAEVIREYAQRYPDLIIPIFQKENQFSQGISPYRFMEPLIRGKYIAQCEGDDFWCDDYKLQKQVDYMEEHPECRYCFCNSYKVNLNSEVIGMQTPVNKSRVFSDREIIAAPEIYLATAGTMYRRTDMLKFPKELTAGEPGDIPLRNFLMTLGNAYGFSDRMCCYRVMTPGSWSDRYQKAISRNPEEFLKLNRAYIEYYENFDRYTGGKYHDEIAGNLNQRLYLELRTKSDWKALHKPPFSELFRKCSGKQKMIVFIKYYLPMAVRAYRLVRYGKEGLKKKY